MRTDTTNAQESAVTVYFDGACPLCRREIALYRNLKGADAVDWIDVSGVGERLAAPDLTKQDALRRFHVRRRDGRLTSGAAAFAELWMALPGLARPGQLLALPGIRHVAEGVYRAFLVVRPLVQRLLPR